MARRALKSRSRKPEIRGRHVGVVVAAGGRGARLPGDVPKQFLLLHRMPILLHSLRTFEEISSVREIVIVVPADQVRRTDEMLRRWRPRKVSHVVVGGSERQHSVRNGLLSFDEEPEIVLVHDAVRPLVSKKIIVKVIDESRKHGAAVVGVRVKDTIKVEERGFYRKTLDRSKLWAVQTPQGFRYDVLMKAHLASQRTSFIGTDEASLVERLRIPVRVVEGDDRNLKITTKADLRLAEMLLKS
ncbi:MAG: 2-C-methyl-D-erythritol 4-phosphate cytidylyltransferase [Ignavibacteriae bacterium]|nr:2-C-methyl-D-erythritol 4-phosphate cytidylyltransferase [Ignavibacteriota bacterium]